MRNPHPSVEVILTHSGLCAPLSRKCRQGPHDARTITSGGGGCSFYKGKSSLYLKLMTETF